MMRMVLVALSAMLIACSSGEDRACGGEGQACCQEPPRCAGHFACNGRVGVCELPTLCRRDRTLTACVGRDQDPDHLRCEQTAETNRTCVDGCCEACGGPGQPCCGGDTCQFGATCDTSICIVL